MTRNVAFFEKYIQNLVITPPHECLFGTLSMLKHAPQNKHRAWALYNVKTGLKNQQRAGAGLVPARNPHGRTPHFCLLVADRHRALPF